MGGTGTALHLVIYSCGSWWVDVEGISFGPYQSREDAGLEGLQLAHSCANAGRPSRVMIPDETGHHHRVMWNSAHDAPPRRDRLQRSA